MVFEEIYTTYWQKVFRICMGYVNDPEWAKDIAQETFIKVWQQLPKFRNESSIGTWIFRITSNHCLAQIDRSGRIPQGRMTADIAEPEAHSKEKELDFLYRCISDLPETDRLVISLELEDIKQAEIAGILGISEANVRVKIHRIKEKLTQKFKEYER